MGWASGHTARLRAAASTAAAVKRWQLVLAGAGALALSAAGARWLLADAGARPSVCVGTPANGSLERGWKLPRSGENFRAYGDVGWLAGRTHLHSRVHGVVVESYAKLARERAGTRFVYGETGWETGGEIAPHRTHRNGLSVDFMVPVLDLDGRRAELVTHAANKYGYAVEFDTNGRSKEGQRIDFESLAAHLAAIAAVAKQRGVGIAKVIFDPKLRAKLAATERWSEIRTLPFSTKPAWVRHDEHYHVDFSVPCRSAKR